MRPLDGTGNMMALPDLGALEYNPSANRWPIADAGVDRIVTTGLPATFSGLGSVDPDGTIASYIWDFGDGTMGSGAMVTHTYSGGTDRVVTLTVTDNAGAIDVDTINVEVNLPPVANAGPTRFADPAEIVMFNGNGSTDADGTIVTYLWDFGDGSSASGQSVTHQYTTGGAYTVTLTVTDDDGATGVGTTTANITGNDGAPPTIGHMPITAVQQAGTSVMVSADVTDASGVASVVLYYRTSRPAGVQRSADGELRPARPTRRRSPARVSRRRASTITFKRPIARRRATPARTRRADRPRSTRSPSPRRRDRRSCTRRSATGRRLAPRSP